MRWPTNPRRLRRQRSATPRIGLLLAIRGEAFRRGEQHSRRIDASMAPRQWAALNSTVENAVRPAVQAGWTVDVAADVAVRSRALAESYRDYLLRALPDALGLRVQPPQKTQLHSILATLRWCLGPLSSRAKAPWQRESGEREICSA